MKSHAQGFRLGLFMVSGLALLVTAVFFVLGAEVFSSRTKATLQFTGSVYGLREGAPVVFRGVPIGNVKTMGLLNHAGTGTAAAITVPVTVALDSRKLVRLAGGSSESPTDALRALIAQGLSAKLTNQSLLTGQLFVDLDLRPAANRQALPGVQDAMEIPTMPSTMSALQMQLENIDIKAMAEDLAAIASATRQLVSDPQLKRTLANVAQLTADLQALSQQVRQQVGPLSRSTQATLAEIQTAARELGRTATSVAQTAQRADQLLNNESPLLQSVQRAANELAQTSASLRNVTGEDAELVRNLDRAARDVARAARQLGDLTQLLERQPDALLRGRTAPP